MGENLVDTQSIQNTIERNFSYADVQTKQQSELIAAQSGLNIELVSLDDENELKENSAHSQEINPKPIALNSLPPFATTPKIAASYDNIPDPESIGISAVTSVVKQFLDQQKPQAISQMTSFIQKYLEFKLSKAVDSLPLEPNKNTLSFNSNTLMSGNDNITDAKVII